MRACAALNWSYSPPAAPSCCNLICVTRLACPRDLNHLRHAAICPLRRLYCHDLRRQRKPPADGDAHDDDDDAHDDDDGAADDDAADHCHHCLSSPASNSPIWHP